MLKAALTGGIASGKSTVAAMFKELGARIIDTDELARRAVQKGTDTLVEIVWCFGPGILGPDGELDRAALRRIIFNDPRARKQLNAMVHPVVQKMVADELARLEREAPGAVVLVDVPLLYEVGWDKGFDTVILVYATAGQQALRLAQRDGVSIDQAQAALKAQMPIDQKKQRAQFLVDNTRGLAETQKEVGDLWARLSQMAKANTKSQNADDTG